MIPESIKPRHAARHASPPNHQRCRVPAAVSDRRPAGRLVRALAARVRLRGLAAPHLRLSARRARAHFLQHVRAVHVRQRHRAAVRPALFSRLLPRLRGLGRALPARRHRGHGRAALSHGRRLRRGLRTAARLRDVFPAAHGRPDLSADPDAGADLRDRVRRTRARVRGHRHRGGRSALRPPGRNARGLARDPVPAARLSFHAAALTRAGRSLSGTTTKTPLNALALVVLSVGAPHYACAQYPTRPIRSIMTVAGGADIVARLVAQGLTEALGQPVVVESQAGAGGAIGAETVARAAPDGHTIMLASASTVVMNRFLSKSARLDPLRDFMPITKAFETVALVVTSPSLPVDSVQELIEYARRNPGKLSFGTSGVGTTHHLSGESIRLIAGIDWVHVPYKGGPPVLTDLLSGQIQVGFSILATAAPFVSSGKIKLLAINGAKRFHVIPNVPTVGERLPGYEAPSTWGGYFGPAGMPPAIVARLHDEIVKVLSRPEVRSKAEDIGFVIDTSTPEELTETIRRDIAHTSRIVKAIGIRPE